MEIEPCSSRPDLPDKIIVKQMKDEWEEEFQQEENAYTKLHELQGTVIPKFFGKGSFNGHLALFLSWVEGITLYNLARNGSSFEEEALGPQLEKALRELHDRGAEYWDPRLDNFFVCDDGKVMVVDLEQVEFPQEPQEWEDSVNFGNAAYLEFLFSRARGYCASSSTKLGNHFGTKSPTQVTDREMAWDPSYTDTQGAASIETQGHKL